MTSGRGGGRGRGGAARRGQGGEGGAAELAEDKVLLGAQDARRPPLLLLRRRRRRRRWRVSRGRALAHRLRWWAGGTANHISCAFRVRVGCGAVQVTGGRAAARRERLSTNHVASLI
jgi:hypothetical protein